MRNFIYMKYQYVFFCLMISLSILLFTGCYTQRAAGLASNSDYNKRVSVKGARTVKRSNAVGITVNIGLVGAGAYAGYNTPLIYRQTETGKEPIKAANAVVGAVVGAGVGFLFDQIAGRNKSNYNIDPNKWIQKANPEYRYIDEGIDGYRFIHYSAERNYIVRSIEDVQNFRKVFPYSNYADDVVQQALKLKRDDMLVLLTLYPNSRYSNDIKVKYVAESLSFTEALNAAKEYPVEDIENLLLNKVNKIDDAIQFIQTFPSFPNKKALVINAFKSSVGYRSDMAKLKSRFNTSIYLSASDLDDTSNSLRRNYFNGMYLLENPTDINAFDGFVAEYSWLKFDEKGVDFLLRYWDIIEPRYSRGIDVLTNFAKVSTNPKYSNVGVKQRDLIQVINEKFEKEVNDKVRVASVNQFGAQNEDFERWKNETGGPIALKLEGEVNFIVYGEVQNSSKFDLPIEITAGGMLQLKRTSKAANWVEMEKQGVTLLGLAAGFVAEGLPDEIRDVEYVERKSFIPMLPAREKTTYVVMVDFGKHEQGGAVVWGLIQHHMELFFTQMNAKASYYRGDISVGQINNQTLWQSYVKDKRLPSSARLYDYSLDLMRIQTGMLGGEIGGIDYELSKGFHEGMKDLKRNVDNYIVEILNQPGGSYLDGGLQNNITLKEEIDPETVDIPKYSMGKWTKRGILSTGSGDEYLEAIFSDGITVIIYRYNSDKTPTIAQGRLLTDILVSDLRYGSDEAAIEGAYVLERYGKIRMKGQK